MLGMNELQALGTSLFSETYVLVLCWSLIIAGCCASYLHTDIHIATLHGKCLKEAHRNGSRHQHGNPHPGLLGLAVRVMSQYTVSKQRFIDFYVVGLCATLLTIPSPDLMTKLFQVHLLRRILEESRKPGDSRMSVAAYIMGLGFYLLAVASVRIGNDRAQQPSYLIVWVMLVAALTQMVAHNHLIVLRRLNPTKYSIPQNILFWPTYFPHYVSEWVVYGCVALCRRTAVSIMMSGAVGFILFRNALNQKAYYGRLLKTNPN